MIIEFFRRGLKKDMSESKQMLFARNLICACIESDDNADYQRGLAPRVFKKGSRDDIGYKKKNHSDKLPIEIISEANGVRNVQNKKGKLGTFVIQVVYRQDATWQGHVIHQEKNEKVDFVSALELIKIMDRALRQ